MIRKRELYGEVERERETSNERGSDRPRCKMREIKGENERK